MRAVNQWISHPAFSYSFEQQDKGVPPIFTYTGTSPLHLGNRLVRMSTNVIDVFGKAETCTLRLSGKAVVTRRFLVKLEVLCDFVIYPNEHRKVRMKSLFMTFQTPCRRTLLGRPASKKALMCSIDIHPNHAMLMDVEWASQSSIPGTKSSDCVGEQESLEMVKEKTEIEIELLRSSLLALSGQISVPYLPGKIQGFLMEYRQIERETKKEITAMEKKLDEIAKEIGAYRLMSTFRSMHGAPHN